MADAQMLRDVEKQRDELFERYIQRAQLLIRAVNMLNVADQRHIAVTTSFRAASERLRADIMEELKR